MKHRLNKLALAMTAIVVIIFVWLVVVFIMNWTGRLEKYKTFFWFGWCPVGTSDSFNQSQNAFMSNNLIKANNICCPSGYYGTLTLKDKNICCRNKFDCSND